jgi:hypothetical protein
MLVSSYQRRLCMFDIHSGASGVRATSSSKQSAPKVVPSNLQELFPFISNQRRYCIYVKFISDNPAVSLASQALDRTPRCVPSP